MPLSVPAPGQVSPNSMLACLGFAPALNHPAAAIPPLAVPPGPGPGDGRR